LEIHDLAAPRYGKVAVERGAVDLVVELQPDQRYFSFGEGIEFGRNKRPKLGGVDRGNGIVVPGQAVSPALDRPTRYRCWIGGHQHELNLQTAGGGTREERKRRLDRRHEPGADYLDSIAMELRDQVALLARAKPLRVSNVDANNGGMRVLRSRDV